MIMTKKKITSSSAEEFALDSVFKLLSFEDDFWVFGQWFIPTSFVIGGAKPGGSFTSTSRIIWQRYQTLKY